MSGCPSSPIDANASIPPWERDRTTVRPTVRQRPKANRSPAESKPAVEAPKKLNRRQRRRRAMLEKRQRKKRPAPRPQELQPVDYKAYINSPLWKARRQTKIDLVGGKCERCGRRSRLHVHHKHYRTLGREKMKDLEVLCFFCHGDHHLAEVLGVCVESLDEYMLNKSRYAQ